jgi:hypothetical protein
VDVFVVVGIVGGSLALIWKGLRFFVGIYRRVQDFLDDWNGETARPGVPARPGFPARLATLEAEVASVKAVVSNGLSHNVADIQQRLKGLEETLTPSGGPQ